MIINVIAPVIAPLSGGAVIAGTGWRAVFWAQAALALVMSIGVLIFAKESLPESERTRGGLKTTIRSAGEDLSDRNYLGYLLTFCFVFANATALALEETGGNAGTGSALLGFLQFTLAAMVSSLVGIRGEETAVPMALAMIVLSVVAFGTLTRKKPTGQGSADFDQGTAAVV